MPRMLIQINGETVKEFGGEVASVEIKSSQGFIREFIPDGQSRINLQVNLKQDFAENLEDVVPKEAPTPKKTTSKKISTKAAKAAKTEDSGFKLPTE